MGGRGSKSGAGSGGANVSVTSVVTQSGDTADLSKFPLQYGKPDPAISKDQRETVEKFEESHLKAKVEYGQLVDANGNEIYSAKGGKGSVSMPTYLYRRASVMTHNHPRGSGQEGMLGGTFSDADMQAFSGTSGLSTMRASAAEGTYSITKGSNFDKRGFDKYISQVVSSRRSHYDRANIHLMNECSKGNISYSEYKARATDEFNHFLVGLHKDYLAGASQYGYNYTLERRGS